MVFDVVMYDADNNEIGRFNQCKGCEWNHNGICTCEGAKPCDNLTVLPATKTPEEVIKWCNMMLNLQPNVEDANFFKSIKWYMQSEIWRTDLATKCTAYLDEFREEKKISPTDKGE